MIKKEYLINDAYFVEFARFEDNRGFFQKTLTNYSNQISEQYFSKSNKNVLRGVHFQIPPYDQEKIITCISGKALDFIIDLRVNSKAYLKFATINLNANDGITVFIPRGYGHGFLALENNTILLYNTTTSYSADHDSGILWNSTNYKWPIIEPIISERDLKFPKLDNFTSPFKL